MYCWICGALAKTREHKIKASDLLLHFGSITQNNPAVRWPKNKRQEYIKSQKSPKFTFDSLLCACCNNSLTQPYDKAWETLSKYFFKNRNSHICNSRWEPKKVFPGYSKTQMLNVHLYFIKWFGCKARDVDLPIDFSRLSECLKRNIPNENFYLVFGNTPGLPINRKYALETPIETVKFNESGLVHSAFSFYIIGQIAIKVIYTPEADFRTIVKGAWSPFDKKAKYVYFEKKDVHI